MRNLKKYVALVSALTLAVTGLNQVNIRENTIFASGKSADKEGTVLEKAILLGAKGEEGESDYYVAAVNFFDYHLEGDYKEKYGDYTLKNCSVNEATRKEFPGKNADDGLFLFGAKREMQKAAPQESYNKWTGAGKGVYQGLVKNKLQNGKLQFSDGIYCTDLFPAADTQYIKGYRDYEFLFRKNSDGNYTFDSDANKICQVTTEGAVKFGFDFRTSGPFFTKGVGTNKHQFGFFPFNESDDNNNAVGERHTMFGMELTLEFNVGKDKKVNGKDMIFQFSGDDDVWIFIDGELVLDLGGIHDMSGGAINFTTGEVTYDQVTQVYTPSVSSPAPTTGSAVTATKEAVTARTVKSRSKVGKSRNVKNIQIGENTKHTLKMFYLERGEFDSNCKIQFNMNVEDTTIPDPTPTPEVTATPIITSAPAETETPVPSTDVTETPIAVMTEEPTSTPSIINSEKPEPTKPERTEEAKKTQTPEKTEEPKQTLVPEKTEEPKRTQPPVKTEEPKRTQPPIKTEEPKKTQTPEKTEEPKRTKEPDVTTAVPETTIQPTAIPEETPRVTEKTNAPQSTPVVVITEEPVPGGNPSNSPVASDVPTESATPTTVPGEVPTQNPIPEIVPDETLAPGADINYDDDSDDDQNSDNDDSEYNEEDEDKEDEDKKKSTIIVGDDTPGNLPKTGGVAGFMQNGMVVNCAGILFLLGTAVVFSLEKMKGKREEEEEQE